MLILLLDRLEDIEHARFRALAQIVIDKDSGIKAFEDYIKIAFPSYESRKHDKAQQARNALLSWVKEGPMKITPTGGGRDQGRSKMKQRVAARLASKEQNELHRKVDTQWSQRKQPQRTK